MTSIVTAAIRRINAMLDRATWSPTSYNPYR